MKLRKIIDVGLYALAAFVLLAVVVAFFAQMRNGVTPNEAAQHYEEMKEPLPLPVVIEPIEVVPADNEEAATKQSRRGIFRRFRFLRRRTK